MKAISKKLPRKYVHFTDRTLCQLMIPLTLVAFASLLLYYDKNLSGIEIQHKKSDEVNCQYDIEINKDDGQGKLLIKKCDGKIKINIKTDAQIPMINGVIIDVVQIKDSE